MSVHKALILTQPSGNIGPIFEWGQNAVNQLGDGTTTNRSSPVQLGTSKWSAVASNGSTSAAIRADGALYVWGVLPYGIQQSSPVQLASGTYNSVALGSNHLLAIKSDKTLWGVGLGNSGQLGGGVTTFTQSWSQVARGNSHALALRSDGALFVWGGQSTGELGLLNGSATLAISSPVQIGTYKYSAISAYAQCSYAIRADGILFAWGQNSNGDLGDGTVVVKSSPVQIGSNTWSKIFAGWNKLFAISTTGTLWAFGNGQNGALGDGTSNSRSSPVQIGTSSWSAIGAGDFTTLGLRVDGGLFSWGYNVNGELGKNTAGSASTSSPAQLGTSSWTAVAGGGNNSYAIRLDGALFAWGLNNAGQLGQNDTVNRSSPVQIGTSSWASISSGASSGFAIRTDGALFGWGLNTSAQLGDNSLVNRSSPVQIGTSSWTQIFAGQYRSNSGITNNQIYTWGFNSLLGDNTSNSNSSNPVQISTLSGTVSFSQIGTSSWSQIAAGGNASAGITTANSLFVWGDNSAGQLGDYTKTNKYFPTQVAPLSWNSVSKGLSHSAAVRSDGALFTWGLNTNGQLGDGTTVQRSSPVQVGYSSWATVSCSVCHTMALRSDRTAWGWGSNVNGPLGTNSTTNASSPVQIGTLSWNQVIAFKASTSSAGIRSDGTLYTWGFNSQGQLGTNDVISRSSPTQITTNSYTQVSAYHSNTAAIRTDGGLLVWGINSSGQLGQNDTVQRSSPVQIGTSSWTQVSVGSAHMLALRTDSGMFAWGANTNGRLGDNSAVNRSSPVQIGTSSWSAVSAAGDTINYAIRQDKTLWGWGFSASAGQTLGVQVHNQTLNPSSPIQIGTASWNQIDAYSTIGAIGIYNNGIYNWTVAGDYGNNGPTTALAENTWYPYLNWGSVNNTAPTTWNAVSVGPSHITAIDNTNYNVYVQGSNTVGQLGATTDPIQSWSQIATGGDSSNQHSIGLRSDGILWFLGGNDSWGQAAQGTTANTRSSPVQIGSMSWSKIAAGYACSYGIRSDGKLFAWGYNAFGQLGSGDAVAQTAGMVQISNSSWSQISAGGWRNTASDPPVVFGITTAGALYTWGGDGANGMCGLSTINTYRSSPVQIGSSSWNYVAAGGLTVLAIRTDGALFEWGATYDTNVTGFRSSPVQVGTSSWTTVAAGYSHALGITTNGSLWSWGNNGNGQLGTNVITARTISVLDNTNSWSIVSAIGDSSFATRTTGALYAWGYNTPGLLGLNDANNRSSPVQIGSSSWAALASGFYGPSETQAWQMGITSTGLLYAWGNNGQAQLGILNSVTSKSSPTQLYSQAATTTIQKLRPTLAATGSWTQVAAGSCHTMAIKSDKTLWGWGNFAAGDSTSKVLFWQSVAAGASNTYAIRSDGALFAWGYNVYGQIGDGTVVNRSSPVQIGTSSWTMISTAYDGRQAAGILTSGALFVWGQNSAGAVGDNTIIARSSPVQIGSSSWTMVVCGTVTAGLTVNGLLYVWGSNQNGEVGDNSIVNRSSPVQIGTSSWSQIFGNRYIFALKAAGSLWSWGYNAQGTIGDNSAVNRSSPVQIGTNSWTMASSGGNWSAGITTDGKLWTWGQNASGALGQNLATTTVTSSPVQIATNTSFVWVSAGQSGGLAISASPYTLWGWGQNTNGQLTDGTIVNRSSPVQITAITSPWLAVAGQTHMALIDYQGYAYTGGSNAAGELGGTTTAIASNQSTAAIVPGTTATTALNQNQNYYFSSPTQVGALSYKAVAAGQDITFAISSTNKLYGWGGGPLGAATVPVLAQNMSSGDIGGNRNATVPFTNLLVSPVQIGTSNFIAVSAGTSHVGAVKFP